MIESLKACMNDRIVQLTDMRTAPLAGVDEVHRMPWDGKRLVLFRMQHLARLDQPFITCDADMIFKRSVLDVWREPFEVALTYRTDPLTLTIDHEGEARGADIAKTMPINTGLMFSRSQKFWEDCVAYMQTLPEERLNWWGDQMAVCEVAERYNVKKLSCNEFNWTPSSRDDYNGARVVHYKGTRKKWMH